MSPPSHPDEELLAFEKELEGLRPSQPSAGFRTRLVAALQAAEAMPVPDESTWQKPRHAWSGWLPLASAAAVAVAAVFFFPARQHQNTAANSGASSGAGIPDGPVQVAADAPMRDAAAVAANPSSTPRSVAPDSGQWQAFSSQSHLQRVDYGGIFQENSQSPYRQIRQHYLENRVYRNPADGTTVEVHVPREEWIFLPVSIE